MSEYPIRASSFPRLMDCAHYWEGVVLMGMRTWIGMPAVMGTALHESTAVFDQGRIDGTNISADDAAEKLLHRLQHPGDDYKPQDDDFAYCKAESICLTLHARYCNEWSPRYRFESVEMRTKPLIIDCGDGIKIRLTGTLDRCRVVLQGGSLPGGKRSIYDIKTGQRVVIRNKADASKHKAQLGTYELLYEHTTGYLITAPGGVIGMQTSANPKIAEGEVRDAKLAMIGTADQPGWLQAAALMFKAGVFPGNPASNLCSPKYCPRWQTCIFR